MKYAIFSICILLTGCTTVAEFSNNEPLPLGLQLGTKALTEEVCLFTDPAGFFSPEISNWLLVNELGNDGCKGAGLLERIPKGGTIKLKKLVKQTGYGLFIVERWFVIGVYEKKQSEIKFFYRLPWSQDVDDNFIKFDKVPWENGL